MRRGGLRLGQNLSDGPEFAVPPLISNRIEHFKRNTQPDARIDQAHERNDALCANHFFAFDSS